MPDFSLFLLGPFQAVIGSETISDFPTDKIRALLAYLALESDRPHRRDRLAGLLWSDWPNQDALKNLRMSLFRLRKTLDAHAPGLSQRLLTVTRQTVQLHSGQIVLDIHQFRSLIAAADAHAHSSPAECGECLEYLEQAIQRYRGEFLAGFSAGDAYLFDEWLSVERERLHQELMHAIQTLADAFEQRRETERAASFVSMQLQLEPWREEAHRRMMRLLAESGRRSEALAQFESVRRILKQELEAEPEGETRRLYAQIKAGEWPPKSERHDLPVLHHFPTQFTIFVGREEKQAEIVSLLRDPSCRLLTLVGPGGIGKTRLSLQAAQALAGLEPDADSASKRANTRFEVKPEPYELFRDGVYFIPLAGVASADLLETTLAGALNLNFQSAPSLRPQLLMALRKKRLLLVLDSLEHLVAGAGFLEEILHDSPGVKILATSRQPLNLQMERILPVPGLALPGEGISNGEKTGSASAGQTGAFTDYSAVQLFHHAARRVRPGFSPQETDDKAIAQICRLLDGSPLAIEIAASWTRILDPPAIARQIKDDLDFLVVNWQDVPERHRSMRTVFEQSWRLLAEKERTALASLSVFTGGFTLDAVLEVTQSSLLQLAALMDKSLLRRTGEQRYELHDLTRKFAAEKLASAGEDPASPPDRPAIEELQLRHCRFYLAQVARTGSQLAGRFPRRALHQIRLDLDNIRQAWHWASLNRRQELLSQALPGLSAFYLFSGLFEEGEQALAEAISRTEEDHHTKPALLAQLLASHAEFLAYLGKYGPGIADAERSLAVARNSADALNQVAGLLALGRLLENTGDYDRALPLLQDARMLCEGAAGLEVEWSTASGRIGRIHWRRSESQLALDQYHHALRIQRRIGFRAGEARTLNDMGIVYKTLSAYEDALDCFRQGIQIAEEFGHLEDLGKNNNNMGMVYWQMGHRDRALDCYRRSLAIAVQLGHLRGQHATLTNMGIIYREQGDYEQALAYYRQALEISQELGYPYGTSTVIGNIGNIHRERGEYGLALEAYKQALEIDRELENIEGIARVTGYLAIMHREQGEHAQALECLQRSIPLLRRTGAKYYLAWQLIDQAESFIALQRYAEAQAANEEGEQLAVDIDRKEYIFQGRLVKARLASASGDPAEAKSLLDALLEDARNDDERAAVHYALWQLEPVDGREHRETALQIYRRLIQHTPKAEYRRCIRALERVAI